MTTIAHVRISNILGVEHIEFDAGRFTAITGPNGTGKTSILEAIKAALKGGHDATLLRNGAAKGESVLVLDDGTEIRRTVQAGKSDLQVVGPNGRKMVGPASVIKALTDALSVNPIEFLRAPAKERVNVLLESMPLKADPAAVAEAIAPLVAPIADGHALVVLDGLAKTIYDERTGTQRAAKEKRATISQLSATLPATMPDASGADEAAAELAKVDATRDAELARIQAKLDGIRAEHLAKLDKIREDAASRIREIERERDAAIEAERKAMAETSDKANNASNGARQRHLDAATRLHAAIAAAKSAVEQRAKAEQTRTTIETMTADAEKLEAEAATQSAALKNLDGYKARLLSALPIPGLTVAGGEVLCDGVPFDRLNTAKQVGIAVEIAKLRAGALKVVCVDGLEALDAPTFAEFRRQAEASGIQMFVTRVADGGGLTILTHPQAAAPAAAAPTAPAVAQPAAGDADGF